MTCFNELCIHTYKDTYMYSLLNHEVVNYIILTFLNIEDFPIFWIHPILESCTQVEGFSQSIFLLHNFEVLASVEYAENGTLPFSLSSSKKVFPILRNLLEKLSLLLKLFQVRNKVKIYEEYWVFLTFELFLFLYKTRLSGHFYTKPETHRWAIGF